MTGKWPARVFYKTKYAIALKNNVIGWMEDSAGRRDWEAKGKSRKENGFLATSCETRKRRSKPSCSEYECFMFVILTENDTLFSGYTVFTEQE